MSVLKMADIDQELGPEMVEALEYFKRVISDRERNVGRDSSDPDSMVHIPSDSPYHDVREIEAKLMVRNALADRVRLEQVA